MDGALCRDLLFLRQRFEHCSDFAWWTCCSSPLELEQRDGKTMSLKKGHELRGCRPGFNSAKQSCSEKRRSKFHRIHGSVLDAFSLAC